MILLNPRVLIAVLKQRNTKARMVWKFFLPQLLIIICVLTATVVLVSFSWRDFYGRTLRQEMERQTAILSRQFGFLLLSDDKPAIQRLAQSRGSLIGIRLTVISSEGEVLGESERSPEELENHLLRPEIQRARRKGTGYARRYSASVRQNMLYSARLIEDGGKELGYIRLARPLTGIQTALNRVYREIAGIGIGALVLAAVASLWLSRRLTEPLEYIRRRTASIAAGSLDTRLYLNSSREIDEVAEAVNSLTDRLQALLRGEQREKAEAMAIAASMSEGIIAIDREERILNINAAALRMLNLSVEHPRGAVFRALVRVPKLQLMAQRVIAGETVREEDEATLTGKTEPRYLQVHSSVLRTAKEKPFGALLVLHDITRMRNLEIGRRQFVANVSHELRTPITAIRGSLETVLDSGLENKQTAERFLNVALRHTLRFEQLIRDLLLLSRIEQKDKDALELRQSDIGQILYSAAAACREQRADEATGIEIACPDGMTAQVNPGIFEQAVVNLLTNALNYSPPDTSVRLRAYQDKQGNIIVQVADHGQGIPAEHIPRIFERFYRVNQDRGRDTGGTGLGLAIVKHVMQLHGGTVEVQSTRGEGTVFTLKIKRGVDD